MIKAVFIQEADAFYLIENEIQFKAGSVYYHPNTGEMWLMNESLRSRILESGSAEEYCEVLASNDGVHVHQLTTTAVDDLKRYLMDFGDLEAQVAVTVKNDGRIGIASMRTIDVFAKELEALINKHSKENESNTPDFLLARYLKECLNAYNTVVTNRDAWHQGNLEDVSI